MALLIGLYHSLTAARRCEPFPLLFSKNNDTSFGDSFTFASGSFIIGVLVEFVSQGSSSCPSRPRARRKRDDEIPFDKSEQHVDQIGAGRRERAVGEKDDIDKGFINSGG
jgi:hypothetical protein